MNIYMIIDRENGDFFCSYKKDKWHPIQKMGTIYSTKVKAIQAIKKNNLKKVDIISYQLIENKKEDIEVKV